MANYRSMELPELLAPAGNISKARFALAYGADAVYCGTNVFSLRQRQGNVNYADLEEIIRMAHALGKKVYVPVNIFAHNHHINVLQQAFVKLAELQPDAFIISDAGVFQLAQQLAPNVPIHISTQASITNALGVQFWAKQGATRIILARELNIHEVKEIHQQFPEIEIETFVHGAQCMAYSGRCMLAGYMTDSHKSNIGSCCNSCRWKYKEIEEENRPGERIAVEQDDFGTYIFNAYDMCMLQHLGDLMNAGVVSLKVEGRGRSEFYVARVIQAYRRALDLLAQPSPQAAGELEQLQAKLLASSPRPFDTGFFYGPPMQSRTEPKIAATDVMVGMMEEQLTPNSGIFSVKNEIYQGETVQVMQPSGDQALTLDQLIDATSHRAVPSVHGGKHDRIIIEAPFPLSATTLLWLDKSKRTRPSVNAS